MRYCKDKWNYKLYGYCFLFVCLLLLNCLFVCFYIVYFFRLFLLIYNFYWVDNLEDYIIVNLEIWMYYVFMLLCVMCLSIYVCGSNIVNVYVCMFNIFKFLILLLIILYGFIIY